MSIFPYNKVSVFAALVSGCLNHQKTQVVELPTPAVVKLDPTGCTRLKIYFVRGVNQFCIYYVQSVFKCVV